MEISGKQSSMHISMKSKGDFISYSRKAFFLEASFQTRSIKGFFREFPFRISPPTIKMIENIIDRRQNQVFIM